MKKYDSYARVLPWFMALFLSVLVAACGGGRDPILGSPALGLGVVSVSVTPATASMPTGGIQPLMATATYVDGSTRDVTATSNWASDTPSVATVVQANGVAAGVASGTSVISADFGGKSGSAVLTVTSATLMSMAVAPAAASIPIGSIQPLISTATYSDGSTRDVTAYTNWASGTPSVATVVQTTGVVTGIASGASVITATFGGKNSSTNLTVTAATLASIAVTPALATVPIGLTQPFVAKGTYSDGSIVDISKTAVWTSASPLVATVLSSTGVATGVSAGSALITATSGSSSGSATLTVQAPKGPAAVNLGTAGNFVVLAKSGISTTGTTAIVGDIGVSPIDSTAITGFSLIADPTNVFSTSLYVTGKVYAANYAVPTPTTLTTAINDMETAFTDAAGRATPDVIDLGAGNISGLTLAPGLYKWGTGVQVTSAGVTLSGGPNDVWIFQIAQDLTVGNGAIVTLSGGAQAKNIFWQVSGKATLGTTADFKGNLMSQTLISLNTGAVVTGRMLAQTQVTLNAARVTKP
ncbi:ice-binding family protein [Rhodoferax ferrireducens]|uniref:ice-binding family protein n=1 Tax=Rhodoferax ferrireducens TaxID=192843 RepID=UPI00298E31A6|nr:ice-binding family protein [Rhodoferax ferrireducens]WPC68731.1 ice-binding family protein [Rhodoferax ferrireducens]